MRLETFDPEGWLEEPYAPETTQCVFGGENHTTFLSSPPLSGDAGPDSILFFLSFFHFLFEVVRESREQVCFFFINKKKNDG